MNRMFLFLFALSATIGGSSAVAADYPPAGAQREGRADAFVTTDPRVQDWEWGRGMVIDGAGRIFVAYQVDDPITGSEIHVMRSTDSGASFQLWARRYTNDDRQMKSPSLALVPGAPERVALAYEFNLGDIDVFPYYQTDINVAVARTDQASPVWTARTVLSSLGETLLGTYAPDVTAVMGPNGPVIYVVGKQAQYNGMQDAVVLSRSTDLGSTWSTPFAVKPTQDATDPNWPRIAADDTGDVCVVWSYDGETETGVAKRMASNFATQPADWDPNWGSLDNANNGWFVSPPDVAAQRDGTGFLVIFGRVDDPVSATQRATEVWSTAGKGAFWLNQDMPDQFFTMPRVEPAFGGGWLFTSAPIWQDQDHHKWSVLISASTSNPQFDQEVVLADTWAHGPVFAPAMVAAHPQKDAFAMFWMDDPFDLSPVVRFDATWWSAQGAPLLVDNFPKQLAAAPRTHPAVVDVTARSAGDEVVYADADGLVHVLDGAGNELVGWPQAVGPVQPGQAIAVGDIDGDGDVEIVAPNALGTIHVFEHDGTPRGGWPVDLGERAVHVSLAPVSKLSTNDVVAVCGTEIFLLRPDGTSIEYDHWPVTVGDVVDHPASVGDLDGDGSLEVVVTTGDDVQVFDAKGNLQMLESTGNDPFSAPAVLGDLDRDGDLEIVAPTHGGFVHAWHHDGQTVAGQWPVDAPGLGSLVGLSIANVDGAVDPEVVVTSALGVVTLLESNGTVSANWPVPSASGVSAPAIVDDIDGLVGEVLFADAAATVNARNADGTVPFAWPASTGSPVELSPATGDVDGDGALDLIVLTSASMVRFDLNNTVSVDGFLRWTQFGHDARRTHCATSAEVTTAVGDGRPTTASVRISFAPPTPNPISSGGTTMHFSLPQSARARLEIFDVRGRKVNTLADGNFGPGAHALMWDRQDASGRDVSSGTYFGRLVVELPEGTQTLSQKMTVLQ